MSEDTTQLWREFERGKDYFDKLNLVDQISEAHRFYEGDQWKGLKTGGEKMSVIDIVSPIVDYKVAVVTQNLMEIVYSPANYDDPMFQQAGAGICKRLNDHASKLWESMQMDDITFDAVEDAAISRGAYLHFYLAGRKVAKENGVEVVADPGTIEIDMLDSAGIMFADEQEAKISKQPYVLLPIRRRVADVRKEAKENGIPKGDIENIVSDDDTDIQTGDKAKIEVDTDNESGIGKCTCLLKYWKKDGEIWMEKATKNVVYKEAVSTGLKDYPIAGLVWSRVKGTCRGAGIVNRLVPNQINVNKMAMYRYLNAKMTAFAKPVFDSMVIRNPAALTEFGTAIEVEGMGLQVLNSVGYLQPANTGPDAKAVQDELIQHTKENAGASDVARGSTELDTYRAVLAIQEAAAAPLNKQTIRYKRFIEDIARIWFDFWCNYWTGGLPVIVEEDTGKGTIETQVVIPAEDLQKLKPSIRVDVTPTSAYNKFTEQQKIDNLLTQSLVDFEEYTSLLPDSEPLKGKLEKVVEARAKLQQMQAQMQDLLGYVQAGQQREEAIGTENAQLQQMLGQAAQMCQTTKEKYYKQGQMDAIQKINGGNG